MRCGVSEPHLVTPHPNPLIPEVSQGLRRPLNPIGNGSGLPDLAREFVGWFGSPSGVRIGCEARGEAGWCGEQEEGSGQSVPEPQRGVGVEGRENGPVWGQEPQEKQWDHGFVDAAQSVPGGKFRASPGCHPLWVLPLSSPPSQIQRPFPKFKGFRSCSVPLCFPCSPRAVPC